MQYVKRLFEYIKKEGKRCYLTLIKYPKHIVILIFSLLLIANIFVMSLHFLDNNYEYLFFKYSYINAIYPNQNIDDVLYTDIVKTSMPTPSNIERGNKVVVFNDFDIPEYWVEEIVSVNYSNKTVEITYDYVTKKVVSFSDIIGVYDKNANIIGTLYYTAKFADGFVLLTLEHLFLIIAAYIYLYSRGRYNEKSDS